MLKVQKETASMLTRDGMRLDADIYRPEGEGEFPVLLMRQPYRRAIASTVVYAHPTWYAAQGYIVVIQDVRGRGTSEGEFELFAHEVEDGVDAVNWAASLPGSTGSVGMYGFSYQGMTQLYAAVQRPFALKTICPAMIGYDLYSDWAYEGGAFCLQANLAWAIQLATETARLRGDEPAYQALYAAAQNLPLSDSIPARPTILKDLAPDSFYHTWLDHPRPGEYWEKLSPKHLLQNVDLPMLHIGGWFDTFLRGTLHLYQEMAARSTCPQHLVIGPWAHLLWGQKVGAVDYGEEAVIPVDRLQIRWFDQFLKGIDSGLEKEPPVSLFEMGSNEWRFLEALPNKPKSYFLASTGLASFNEGALVATPAEACLDDVFVHDPWRPVPALGGHAVAPAGSFERSHLDSRTDVLTYTTAPLMADLHLSGEVTAEIYCTADAASFDLCAVLSEVHLDGSVYNLTQGYLRVESQPETTPLRVSLQATCTRIHQGHSLRLSLSAACFPAYPVNSGTGLPPGESRLMEAEVITIGVSCGGDRSSRILLPVA
ncbi:MAG: CocE/NonD family hydrolase [Kastovskya adunca ATA6-11-RM4]|jgi:hypothetical protein|nr:CocE/NonD family hydrolase [Kastovskya adunca ATA6-11-RM4]